MIIYKITNKINNKLYIGKTSKSLEKRKYQHFITSKHKNYPIYKAIRKYGFGNFEWEILCESDCENKLNSLEKFYIVCYKKMNILYNLTNGGEGTFGLKFSDEHRKKLSESHKGYVMPDSQKNKISESNKGKKKPDSFRKKLSERQKNKKVSEETKQKISNSLKGNKPSLETREKLRKNMIGKRIGEKNPNYGKRDEESPNYKYVDKNELEELYSKGHSWECIAKKFNVSISTIHNKLKKYNIPNRNYKKYPGVNF